VKNNPAEGIVQVLILVLVAGMAGAASFTHVHNWTMDNAPTGTGSWFGWANAVISELTPTAAGIEIRRRRRDDPRAPIAYPMAILIAAAVLSLAAQVAEARPTVGGWISSAVPALAFLALTKLVLSRTGHASQEEPAQVRTQPETDNRSDTRLPDPAVNAPESEPVEPAEIEHPVPAETPVPRHALEPVPAEQLRMSAGMIAFNHEVATGQPITSGELAARLGIPPTYAESLLDHLGGTPPTVTAVNGATVNGSRP